MTVLEITPSIKDASIVQSLPNENTGDATVAWMGVYFGASVYRILMEFDLSDIPTSQNIDRAILKVYVSNATEEEVASLFRVHRINELWQEESVTWNNQPTFQETPSSNTTEVYGKGFYEWDITELVRAWVSEVYPNFGLLLKTDEIDSFTTKLIYTRNEAVELELRPALLVEYMSSSVKLCDRCFESIMEAYETTNDYLYSSSFDASNKSTISFIIKNDGFEGVMVKLQLSPDNIDFFDDSKELPLAIGESKVIVPYRFARYMRIAFKSSIAASSSSIKIWYQSQV